MKPDQAKRDRALLVLKLANEVGLHWDTIPTVEEELTRSTKAQMLDLLKDMGNRLSQAELPGLISAAERRWLGAALVAIGSRTNPSTALGLAGGRGKLKYGVRENLGTQHLVKRLVEEGIAKDDALTLIGQLFVDSQGRLCCALDGDPESRAGATIKKRIQRSTTK